MAASDDPAIPPTPPPSRPATEPPSRPATDEDWAALTYPPVVADWEPYMAHLDARWREVGTWLRAMVPTLSHDNESLDRLVAEAPDAFLDVVEGLARSRERLADFTRIAELAEIRLLAALTRLDRNLPGGDRVDG